LSQADRELLMLVAAVLGGPGTRLGAGDPWHI